MAVRLPPTPTRIPVPRNTRATNCHILVNGTTFSICRLSELAIPCAKSYIKVEVESAVKNVLSEQTVFSRLIYRYL